MSLSLGIDKPSFLVHSDSRESGTHEDFFYKLNIKNRDDNENYNQCAIVSAVIPKTFYTLRTDSTLTITELGTPRTVTIPKGNYNIRNFISVFQNKMNYPSPNGWIYSLNYPDRLIQTDTRKFTIVVNNNYFLTVLQNVTLRVNNDTNLHHMLGLDFDTDYVFNSVVIPLSSVRPVDFQHTKFIVIKSDLANNHGNEDGDIQVLCKIPCDNVPDGGLIRYNLVNLEDESKALVGVKNELHRFTLYDDHNEVLDLNDNDWFMNLFMYRHNFHDELSIHNIRLMNLEKLTNPPSN